MVKPFSKIIDVIQQKGWVQEVQTFDENMKTYLSIEAKKYLKVEQLVWKYIQYIFWQDLKLN